MRNDDHEHNQILALGLLARAEALARHIHLDDKHPDGNEVPAILRGLVMEAFWLGVDASSSFSDQVHIASAVHKSTGRSSSEE